MFELSRRGSICIELQRNKQLAFCAPSNIFGSQLRGLLSRRFCIKPTKASFTIRAAQGSSGGNSGSSQDEGSVYLSNASRPGRTRLTTRVTTLPRRVDLYFAGNFNRQAVWASISFGAGFYCANTVSLSFGALAINDVLAAAITVVFCEVVSRAYYSAPRVTLKLIFLNSFKMGVVAAFIADAFKLAG